jgi:hypothetical protein
MSSTTQTPCLYSRRTVPRAESLQTRSYGMELESNIVFFLKVKLLVGISHVEFMIINAQKLTHRDRQILKIYYWYIQIFSHHYSFFQSVFRLTKYFLKGHMIIDIRQYFKHFVLLTIHQL